jgi:drug/metabolite transporter (DMT)-like permease
MQQQLRGYMPLFLLMLLALIWGSSFILMKRGLLAFSSDQVGALRIGIAAVVMLPWSIIALRQSSQRQLLHGLAIGLTGNLLPAFLFAWAQTGMASSLVGVLNALTPIFTFFVGVAVFGTKAGKYQMAGLSLGLMGSLSISLFNAQGVGFNQYALMVIVATIMYGVSANLIKSTMGGIRSMQVAGLAMLFTGPMSWAYFFTTDWMPALQAEGSLTALAYIAVLGIFGTAIGTILFNRLIQSTSAVFASSVTYLIPVVAIFWGLYDGESLYLRHYIGMMLILGGIFLVRKAPAIKN